MILDSENSARFLNYLKYYITAVIIQQSSNLICAFAVRVVFENIDQNSSKSAAFYLSCQDRYDFLLHFVQHFLNLINKTQIHVMVKAP